jgi:hypothetical protein
MPATNRFGLAYHVHLFDTVGIDGKGCRDLLLALIHRDLQHRRYPPAGQDARGGKAGSQPDVRWRAIRVLTTRGLRMPSTVRSMAIAAVSDAGRPAGLNSTDTLLAMIAAVREPAN